MFYLNRIILCLTILVLSTLFVHSHVAAESNRSVIDSLVPNHMEDREDSNPSDDSEQDATSSVGLDEADKSGVDNDANVNKPLDGEVEAANQDSNFNNTASTDESSPLKIIFNLIFYTLIMVALIIILFKFLAYKQRKMGEHQLIQTMGGTSLGNNKSLQLVKVGGSIYLLGVADQISLIKEIDDQELIDQLESDQHSSVDYITKGIEGLKSRFINGPEQVTDSSFQVMFEDSIQKQKEKMKQVDISMQNSSYSSSERRNQPWNP